MDSQTAGGQAGWAGAAVICRTVCWFAETQWPSGEAHRLAFRNRQVSRSPTAPPKGPRVPGGREEEGSFRQVGDAGGRSHGLLWLSSGGLGGCHPQYVPSVFGARLAPRVSDGHRQWRLQVGRLLGLQRYNSRGSLEETGESTEVRSGVPFPPVSSTSVLSSPHSVRATILAHQDLCPSLFPRWQVPSGPQPAHKISRLFAI